MPWWGWILLVVIVALLCAVGSFYLVTSMWWYYLHHCSTCGARGSLFGPLRGWHRGKLQKQQWHCPRHSVSDIEANERRDYEKWKRDFDQRHGFASTEASADTTGARQCSKCDRVVSEVTACKSCAAEFCYSCLGKTIAVQHMAGSEEPIKCLSCGMAFV